MANAEVGRFARNWTRERSPRATGRKKSAICGWCRCSSRLFSPPQPQQRGQTLDSDDGVDDAPDDWTPKNARGLLDRLIGRKEPERTKTHESEQNNDDGTGPDRPGHENAHEDKQGQQS